MTTADIHALVGAYALDAVDDVERAAFDRHLAECDPCLRYLRQMRATGAALRLVPAEQVTETLSDQAVDTLLDAFRRRR